MAEILRLVAGGLIALVCAYIGLIVKRRYKSRERIYTDARDYFVYFERELVGFKTTLPEINAKYAKQKAGEFSDFLIKYYAKTEQKNALSALKKEEKSLMEEALSGLGKTSFEEQIKYLKRWQSEYSEKAEKAATDNKKYGGMYFKLCVLLGIAAIILLA